MLFLLHFCRLLIVFKINFLEKFFQDYHQNVKQFDPDQDVGPDLGPNCLQRLSAGVTSRQKENCSDLLFSDVQWNCHLL